jgi:hypothetical protein
MAKRTSKKSAKVAKKAAAKRRFFCRPCLDWSERRYHLAGHVGAEICRRCLEIGWFKRERVTHVPSG